MSHPRTGKREVFLCIRHPMLVLLATAEPNPAGTPKAFNAGQHRRTKKVPVMRVFHSETLSGRARVPARDRGCRGGEHSVHVQQREAGEDLHRSILEIRRMERACNMEGCVSPEG